MREIMLVARREFRERVATKSFLIGTIAFPLLMAALVFIPVLAERGGAERSVVVVDQTSEGYGAEIARILTLEPEDESANRYTAEVVRGNHQELAATLIRRVETEEIDGYLVVPADLIDGNEVTYRSTTIASPGMLRDMRAAASEVAQAERLRAAGLEGHEVAALVRPVYVGNVRLTATGEEAGDAESAFWMAYILAFVIYFMVFFYGVHVMRSVLEEKTSRIAEVLVSSLRATHLMAGKILGVAGAALLQVAIWALLIVLMMGQSNVIAAAMGADPDFLGSLSMEPAALALLLAFFILGFFLYAAIFAALGAAVTSEQEAQSFQMVLLVPLILPLMFLLPLTTEPLSSLSTFLGIFPLTSPVAMPMRLASAPIPPLQVAGALAALAVALIGLSWIAGKIYRIGILSTGKRPTMAELARWLRTA